MADRRHEGKPPPVHASDEEGARHGRPPESGHPEGDIEQHFETSRIEIGDATMLRNYIGVVHKEPKSCYGISFPDFPGCISSGDTLDDLHNMGIEALQFHVEGMLEDGESIPDASPLDQVKKNPEHKGADAFLIVPVELPEKAVRINVTIQDSVLKKIDNYAKRHSETRSAVLASAAVEYIKAHK